MGEARDGVASTAVTQDGVAWQALPFSALSGILVGSSVVAARFGVGQMEPTVFLGLRLGLAAAAFVAIFTLRGWAVERRLWPALFCRAPGGGDHRLRAPLHAQF